MNQGIAENYSEFLSYLQCIQVDQHILRGRRGSEENVKTKIVIPLLQAIGWDVLSEMDFERAGADIVLLEELPDEGAPLPESVRFYRERRTFQVTPGSSSRLGWGPSSVGLSGNTGAALWDLAGRSEQVGGGHTDGRLRS